MGSGGEGSGGGAGAASLRETHDFSNVASFSELPFLRSAPARESTSSSGIRIFGIDVPHSSPEGKAKETTPTVADATAAIAAATQSSSGSAIAAAPDSSRKFECHYCCRHFPTSQALGGHQNAHKRERQHAKRVQMQSAMAATAAAAGGVHHHHLLGYPQHRFGMAGSKVATLYPSWPTAGGPGGRGGAIGPQFYSGVGSIAQPITGNPPSAGLWRGMPAGHGNMSIPPGGERRPVVLSAFRGDEPRPSASLLAPSSSSSSSLLLSPQGQFVCEQPATTASEGVSLDLRL